MILEAAALREWHMLVAARSAFWSLGLDMPPHAGLVSASKKRIARAVQEGFWTPRRAHTLSMRLEEYEDAAGAKSAAVVAVDSSVQDAETRRGRIVAAVVRGVRQPKRSCRPCEITLETDQPIVRLRREDRVRSLDDDLTAVVRGIRRNPATGNRVIVLELTKGFRSTSVLSIGSTHRWTADDGYPLALRMKALRSAAKRAGWLISGGTPPAASPRHLAVGDPLELAQQARRHP